MTDAEERMKEKFDEEEKRLAEEKRLKNLGITPWFVVKEGPTGRLTKNQKEAIRRRKRREAAEKARKV